MLFNASNACNARKLYVIGAADVVAGYFEYTVPAAGTTNDIMSKI